MVLVVLGIVLVTFRVILIGHCYLRIGFSARIITRIGLCLSVRRLVLGIFGSKGSVLCLVIGVVRRTLSSRRIYVG